ncbi:MAG: hypothetical protein AAF481_18260 [Acidobacteriota bacterium]
MSKSFGCLLVLLVVTILCAPVTVAAPMDASERSTVSFAGDLWSQAVNWFHAVAGSKSGPPDKAPDGSGAESQEGCDQNEHGPGMDPNG